MYNSQPYTEAMKIQPSVSYIPYATYSKKRTGYIIKFAQFGEGNLLSESCNNTESCHKSDDDSTIELLISEAKINAM